MAPSAVGQRRLEQLHRLRRAPEDLAVAVGGEQVAAGGVERQARALRRAGIGEVDADAGEQHVEHDRLGDIVDAAGFQPLDDVLGLATGRS